MIPVATTRIKTGINSYRGRPWHASIVRFQNPKRVAASQRNFEKRAPYRVLDGIYSLAVNYPNTDEPMVQDRIINTLIRWLKIEPVGTIEALLGDVQQFSKDELVTSAILRHCLFVLKRNGEIEQVDQDTWRIIQ